MKLFINKKRFLKIINKELKLDIKINYKNKLTLLNSLTINKISDNEYSSIFQEKFLMKNFYETININSSSNSKALNQLERRLSKEFKYMGSKSDYKFIIDKIYTNREHKLVVQFTFSTRNYYDE